MPVEILQGHVGGVCHRQIIPHGLAGQHLGIAPLGDGHPQIGGLVVGADLDDLPGVFQRDVMDGGIYLPVGRGCDFNHLIASQREGLAGRNAPCVRGDVVHHFTATCVDNLINSALQRRPGRRASDLIVFGGILVNLDLAGDGLVDPLDLRRVAGPHIDGLVLLV